MIKREDFTSSFTSDNYKDLLSIKWNELNDVSKSDFRDLVLKLDKSLDDSVSKLTELEYTIIQKDIEYEKLHNQKTILTCFSILFIFLFIISFMIGFYVGNKKTNNNK